MLSIFTAAIHELHLQSRSTFGPIVFQQYLKDNNLPKADTAQKISVDSYEQLDSELKKNDIMVFRLGSSVNGKETQFALAKAPGYLNDFFLIDNQVHVTKPSTYLPRASFRQLYPYQLIATQAETSLVNLAFASGAISYALGLDDEEPITPATGSSIFTFSFKPHSSLDAIFDHHKGQVQVDALFIGKRNNQEHIFVLEAKVSQTLKSLSKHKLVYPLLALASKVPVDIPIIPIYMKAAIEGDNVIYHITECEFPDPRARMCAINELRPNKHSALILPSFTVNK
jgi:hypothetical protein